MDNLHLNLIVEKQLKREIRILNLLNEQAQSISGSEIARILDVSLSTILNDLDVLKEKIPDNWTIEFKKNIGYSLIITEGISMPNYMRDILLDSPLFEIGISIFNNELLDVYDWEERLYVIDSTLKRYLTIFRGVLKKYKLKLSTSPVNIIGKEADIRIFYFDFFHSSSKVSQLEYPTEKEVEFFEELKTTHSYDFLQYHRSLYWIMVVVRRNINGNEIELNQELVEIVKKKISLDRVEKVKKLFLRIFSQKISFNELIFLYLIRWDTLILGEMNKLISIEIVNEEIKKMVNNFILKQIKKLRIDRHVYPQVYPYFILFFTHIFTMSIISPLFQKSTYETKLFVQMTHASLYHFWLDALLENKRMFKNMPDVYFEDIAVQLTMLALTYLKTDFSEPKHIVFILETSVINLNYVTKLAERYILNNVRVTVVSNSAFSENLIETFEADLLVSNIYLETNQKIVYISDLPTVREWNYINDLIFNLEDLTTEYNLNNKPSIDEI